jgi:hypothetical protein
MLPRELNKLYEDLYEKMQSHEAVMPAIERLLKWLMFGGSNLSASAIMTAISLDLEGSGSSEPMARPKILEFCHNLVEEDAEQDRFRLAHLSVKQFLERYFVRPETGANLYPYTPFLSHALIAQKCLAYFCYEVIKPIAHLQENGFHNYAVLHWPEHLKKYPRLSQRHLLHRHWRYMLEKLFIQL